MEAKELEKKEIIDETELDEVSGGDVRVIQYWTCKKCGKSFNSKDRYIYHPCENDDK